MEDCDIVEENFIPDDNTFENAFDDGIITSLEHEYLDEEFDGTIGAEFLGDIPSFNAFVAPSIPFGDVFPDIQLESGKILYLLLLSAIRLHLAISELLLVTGFVLGSNIVFQPSRI